MGNVLGGEGLIPALKAWFGLPFCYNINAK